MRETRKARGDGKPVICLVPNRVDQRTGSGRELHAALEEMGEDVAPDIHSRTSLADAFNLGQWVGAYAPNTPAHLETQALASHVIQKLKSTDKARRGK